MRIAIIGAGGQVGSSLAYLLRKQPEMHPVGIVRNVLSGAGLMANGTEVRVGDLLDEVQSERLLDDCPFVVNCAYPRGLPHESQVLNRRLLRNLLRGGGRRVVHLSSIAVYGELPQCAGSTFDHPRPSGSYGYAKLDVERFARRQVRKTDSKLVVLRLGHVYGPGHHWSRGFLQMLGEACISLPFLGANPSNSIHVAELAAGIAGLFRDYPWSSFAVYNAVSGPQKSWKEVLDLHAAAMGQPGDYRLLPDRESCAELGALVRRHRRSAIRKVMAAAPAALKGPFLLGLLKSPEIKDLVLRLMLHVPLSWEAGLSRQFQRLAFAERSGGRGPSAELLFHAGPVPGPNLPGAREAMSWAEKDATIVQGLREWHHSVSCPQWRSVSGHGQADSEATRPGTPPAEAHCGG